MFAKMSRLAGDTAPNSLAHDIDILGAAGNQESFNTAKENALAKLEELRRFVDHATFQQAKDNAPRPWDGTEGCGATGR